MVGRRWETGEAGSPGMLVPSGWVRGILLWKRKLLRCASWVVYHFAPEWPLPTLIIRKVVKHPIRGIRKALDLDPAFSPLLGF